MKRTPRPPNNLSKLLQAADEFATGRLRTMACRMARLAGFRGLQHWDHLADLRQEVVLDCLSHARKVAKLSPQERTQRWLRLAQNWVRHTGRATQREEQDLLKLAQATAREPCTTTSTPPQVPVLFRRTRKGRINFAASQGRSRRSEFRLRQQVRELVQAQELDHEPSKWRRHLALALLGVAADRMVLAGLVPGPQAPDPEVRVQRLRRLRARIPPDADQDATARIATWYGAHDRALHACPGELLAVACELAPDVGAAWLWRFEWHLATSERHLALRCLRRAQQVAGLDREAWALAFARYAEVARGPAAAARRLQRLALRCPGQRLHDAAKQLTAQLG